MFETGVPLRKFKGYITDIQKEEGATGGRGWRLPGIDRMEAQSKAGGERYLILCSLCDNGDDVCFADKLWGLAICELVPNTSLAGVDHS